MNLSEQWNAIFLHRNAATLALIRGLKSGLLACGLAALSSSFVLAEDIIWQEFNDPATGTAPMYGPPIKGAPNIQQGCTPAGDAAWYRLCQCPGTGNLACSVGYYSIRSYNCPVPPGTTNPVYLVTARGYTQVPCNENQKRKTKESWTSLNITPSSDYDPPPGTPAGGGDGSGAGDPPIGALDPKDGEKPDKNTGLKKTETEPGDGTHTTGGGTPATAGDTPKAVGGTSKKGGAHASGGQPRKKIVRRSAPSEVSQTPPPDAAAVGVGIGMGIGLGSGFGGRGFGRGDRGMDDRR
jgi:hypothetical protein